MKKSCQRKPLTPKVLSKILWAIASLSYICAGLSSIVFVGRLLTTQKIGAIGATAAIFASAAFFMMLLSVLVDYAIAKKQKQ